MADGWMVLFLHRLAWIGGVPSVVRRLFVLSVLAAFSLGTTACGDLRTSSDRTAKRSSASSTTTRERGTMTNTSPVRRVEGEERDSDDGDDDAGGDDDLVVLHFGRRASVADRRVVTEVVKRYYAAAAAGDGAEACTLLYGLYIETFAEGSGGDETPASLGKACASVTSDLFREHHAQLTVDAATIVVPDVRVEGDRGLAILRFGGSSESRSIAVHREHGSWKVEAVLDDGMP